MRISDLIEILEEAKKEYGNVEVAIQYRDDGGCYYGKDSDVGGYFDKTDGVYTLWLNEIASYRLLKCTWYLMKRDICPQCLIVLTTNMRKKGREISPLIMDQNYK